jgi:hypothetical protein
MTIAKRPKATRGPDPVEAFVNKAPDPNTPDTKRSRVNKVQITLPIHPVLLEGVDQHARAQSISRAAVMARAVLKLLEEEAPEIRKRVQQGLDG